MTMKHTITVDEELEFYGSFLNDNDYEVYMPMINSHTKTQLINAQRNLVRALWIRNRFTTYNTEENNQYARMTNIEYELLNLLTS